MEAKELSLEQFNALNYFVQQNSPVEVIEIDSIPILKSTDFIDSFCRIKLSTNAVSYVNNISENEACEEIVELIKKDSSCDDGIIRYYSTEYAKQYVEYYTEVFLK